MVRTVPFPSGVGYRDGLCPRQLLGVYTPEMVHSGAFSYESILGFNVDGLRASSALMLLVGRQEEYTACKKLSSGMLE